MKPLIPFMLLVLTACSSSQPMSSDFAPGDAEAAIRGRDRDFASNARTGNAAVLVDSFYAADAVLMPPNAQAQHGREAIRQRWARTLGAGAADVTLTPDTVMQSCSDIATEIGHYDFTLTPNGAAAIHDVGKYVVTWKKSGGQWLAVADIFNSDLPAAR